MPQRLPTAVVLGAMAAPRTLGSFPTEHLQAGQWPLEVCRLATCRLGADTPLLPGSRQDLALHLHCVWNCGAEPQNNQGKDVHIGMLSFSTASSRKQVSCSNQNVPSTVLEFGPRVSRERQRAVPRRERRPNPQLRTDPLRLDFGFPDKHVYKHGGTRWRAAKTKQSG